MSVRVRAWEWLPNKPPVKGKDKVLKRGQRLLLVSESQAPVVAWEKNERKKDVKC